VSCHGITHINSVKGNGDYTIQEPPPYPLQYSENKLFQVVNEYLVKAKPDLHKKSMLKPFHRTSEFCQVCHKVSLPEPVNSYKWTRGQNHYDSWHVSGSSGFGARSFYHPPNAKKCSECHMPLFDSKDFGNLNGQVHTHLFLGANTALPTLRLHFGHRHSYPPIGDEDDVIRLHTEFLKDKKLRVDIFALREKGEIDGGLHVLRPTVPELIPGESYLIEVVVRNLGVGHEFSQGTIDSNEIWVQAEASSKGKLLLQSGMLDEHGYLDPWAHTLNAVVLDRHGNRIDRRNAKDIFVPLFNHQVPPSSSQVVHYRLTVPRDQKDPIDFKVAVKYRKFDRLFQDFFMDRKQQPQAAALLSPSFDLGSLLGGLGRSKAVDSRRGPELPVMVMTEDKVTLPIRGSVSVSAQNREAPAQWERFNDYGVGLFLAGNEGAEKGLLKQAEEAFLEVTKLAPSNYGDAWLNLARVYLKEGRLPEMAAVLEKAKDVQPGYFKTAWLRAELNLRNGRLDDAIKDYRQVLETKMPERGFDFGKDREIRRSLGNALFLQSLTEGDGSPEQAAKVNDAIAQLKQVLAIDPEDRDSHYLLEKCYRQLVDKATADKHRAEYEIYQLDDNARSHTVNVYRRNHPWADHSAQSVVIYELRKPGTAGNGKGAASPAVADDMRPEQPHRAAARE
jgi:tetratricopeptide (TPR) repeat protein